jgi:hypothetical protein
MGEEQKGLKLFPLELGPGTMALVDDSVLKVLGELAVDHYFGEIGVQELDLRISALVAHAIRRRRVVIIRNVEKEPGNGKADSQEDKGGS